MTEEGKANPQQAGEEVSKVKTDTEEWRLLGPIHVDLGNSGDDYLSHHNTIENTVIYHGGHHVIGNVYREERHSQQRRTQ